MEGEGNGTDVVIEKLNRRSMKQIDRQEWKTYLKSKLRYETKDGIVQGAYCVDGGRERCEDHL
jgi:hypothetical protein